jgi:hypothetical protein
MFYQFSSNTNSVLSYEDGSAFLMGKANVFAFSSALNTGNSNFQNSQLIVPVLYNMGLQSLKLSKLYYTLGNANSIAITAEIGQDEILTLEKDDTSIIPMQKTFSESVVIETDNILDQVGIFSVKNKDKILQNLSFNHNRIESKLSYYDLNLVKNATISSSLATSLNTIKSSTNVNALWKWFVIFALAFLIIEMLILKFLK